MKIVVKNDVINFIIKSRRLDCKAYVRDLIDGSKTYSGKLIVKDGSNLDGSMTKKVVFRSDEYDFKVDTKLLFIQNGKLNYNKAGVKVEFII